MLFLVVQINGSRWVELAQEAVHLSSNCPNLKPVSSWRETVPSKAKRGRMGPMWNPFSRSMLTGSGFPSPASCPSYLCHLLSGGHTALSVQRGPGSGGSEHQTPKKKQSGRLQNPNEHIKHAFVIFGRVSCLASRSK